MEALTFFNKQLDDGDRVLLTLTGGHAFEGYFGGYKCFEGTTADLHYNVFPVFYRPGKKGQYVRRSLFEGRTPYVGFSEIEDVERIVTKYRHGECYNNPDDFEDETKEDIATGLMDMVDKYIVEKATESSTGNIPDPENEDTDQVRISLTCDRDFTADFLRQLTNAIEEGSVRKIFETPRGCAEIDNLGDPKKAKTFAGLQIASAPLSFNGKNFVIKDNDWNHDSYNSVYGTCNGSYYFNWEQCHDVKEISHAGHDDWRMPTRDEWEAILFGPRAGSTVNGNSGSRYAIVQLTGVTHAGNSTPVGLLLFPDGLTITGKTLGGINNSSCTYGMTDSELQAYLDQGCVFLPASGCFFGSSWYYAGTYGYYWSSTGYDSLFGYYLFFLSSNVNPSYYNDESDYYFPCRLVR